MYFILPICGSILEEGQSPRIQRPKKVLSSSVAALFSAVNINASLVKRSSFILPTGPLKGKKDEGYIQHKVGLSSPRIANLPEGHLKNGPILWMVVGNIELGSRN